MAMNIPRRVERLEARLKRLEVLIERTKGKEAKAKFEAEREAREAELKFLSFKVANG